MRIVHELWPSSCVPCIARWRILIKLCIRWTSAKQNLKVSGAFMKSKAKKKNLKKLIHISKLTKKVRPRMNLGQQMQTFYTHCDNLHVKCLKTSFDPFQDTSNFKLLQQRIMWSLIQIISVDLKLNPHFCQLFNNDCLFSVPLDQPEQFLVELSQMSHFPERMECMMLRKRFNETLFNIGMQCSFNVL